MSKDERWIYDDLLQKRWGMNQITFYTIVEEGLPIYDCKGQRFKYDPEGLDAEPPYKFKMADVEKFEDDHPHLFESGSQGLDAKEKRELGQLRREKENWDASLKVAVQIGMYCQEENKVLSTDEVWAKAHRIDKDLPETTIRKIWKAIPAQYRSKGGRRKKDK